MSAFANPGTYLRQLVGWVRALLFVALAGCSTLPAPGDIRVPTVHLYMRDAQLPSGMRVIAQRDERSAHVVIVAVVGAGGSADPAGKEGLAHLVEHLAFRTEVEPGQTESRLLEHEAAEFNAVTTHDATVYYQVVHRSLFERVLAREVKRIFHPLEGVARAGFDVEREVVRNELRERGETEISGEIWQALERRLFPMGHPYARPVIGTHETLSSLTLADARAFVERWYRPENVTWFIAGDIDVDQLDPLIDRLFPAALIGDPRHPRAVAAPRVSVEEVEAPLSPSVGPMRMEAADTKLAQTELWIGWTLPGEFGRASLFEGAYLEAVLRVTLSRYVEPDVAGVLDTNVFRVPGAAGGALVARIRVAEGTDLNAAREAIFARLLQLWREDEGRSKSSIRNRVYRSVLAEQNLLGRCAARTRRRYRPLRSFFGKPAEVRRLHALAAERHGGEAARARASIPRSNTRPGDRGAAHANVDGIGGCAPGRGPRTR